MSRETVHLPKAQLARLHEYDVIYLTGGDPPAFRENLVRSGVGSRLRECAELGCVLVGASAGAMQMTSNVSLFRLIESSVDEVVATLEGNAGLGLVNYELLPHFNRLDSEFLDKVRLYSERVPHDILAIPDGVALLHSDTSFTWTAPVVRIRRGELAPLVHA